MSSDHGADSYRHDARRLSRESFEETRAANKEEVGEDSE